MDLTFGKGGFIISHSNSEILNSRTGSIKDLSDIESDLTEFISDEKNIADESSGEYWNPDLLIKNCTAEEWNNKFKNMLGAVVNFIPFSDNTTFNFDCTVLECFPVWVDNKYWKCDVKIKLASVLPVIPAAYSLPINIFYFAHELTTAPVMTDGCIFYFSTEIISAPVITFTTDDDYNGVATISSVDGGVIYYEIRLNNTTPPNPTNLSQVYTEPVVGDFNFKISAVVYKNGLYSNVTQASYSSPG